MSRKSLAPRSRSPKPAKVVPFRPVKRRWGPVEHAERDLDIQIELTTMHLRGLRHLLDAWMVFERGETLSANARDDALCFLGAAAVTIGERLELERLKLHMLRRERKGRAG